MNGGLWMLAGAGAYLVVGAAVGAITDIDTRDALTRVLLAPFALLVAPLVWLAFHIPTAGTFQIGNLRRELDAHHHVARGAAYRSWAILVIRRTGPKPPQPERVP